MSGRIQEIGRRQSVEGTTRHRSVSPAHHSPSPGSSRGFTLLGVLIAAFFVVLVTGALASVAQSTGRAQRATRDRFIATLLAREGVELVRAIRDNNWLQTLRCQLDRPCVIHWRGYSEQPNGICSGDGDYSVYSIDADNPRLLPALAGGQQSRLEIVDGHYRHGVEATRTRFRRWVTVTSPHPSPEDCGIPSVFVPNQLTAQEPPPPVNVRVTVVWCAWEDGICNPGPERPFVELSEDLYPWMNFR